ncbi:putative membrane protein [Paenibacillus sp. PvR052]|nr:putative membrane protein [Paenibacillus sp. PvP091]MBP1172443.1 putative membrane protein [Paenibacillus sp. PvR098]MBP2438824.1 putative membrane protein [Paenibacillus sp. PvP052]
MMNEEVDRMMGNPYVETLAIFSVAVLALIVFLAVFELVTKYKDWEEIKKGNVSVAMATGGKIFGICNLFRFAILNNDTIWHSLIWAGYGFLLLLVAYFIFEFLTPYFKIDEQIQQDNRAVGFLSMTISISLSYVVGASVT